MHYRIVQRLFSALLYCLATSTMADSHAAEPCPAWQTLNASYLVSEQQRHNDAGESRRLELWRTPGKVAIHYSDTHITEIWEQTTNGLLHLLRMFDDYARGIEYQPVEIKDRQDWSAKWQLLSNDLLDNMQLLNTTGKACDMQQQFRLETRDASISLTWLPAKQLLKSMTVIRADTVTRWQLSSLVNDGKLVTEKLSQWNHYDTTDYADIGDNESDPFLAKMIHLGFIDHSASGFYDTAGNTPASASHHSH